MAHLFKACAVPGCNKNAHYSARGNRGWCGTHYARWRRKGTLESTRGNSAREQWLSDHADWSGEDCLIWPFCRSDNGYGSTTFKGQQAYAHRAMCELVHGEAPTEAHQAAHSCGNGSAACVNPGHIRWATPQENSEDRIVHGNSLRGEANANAKLAESDVRTIRSRAEGESHGVIARTYGVSRSLVSMIAARKVWAWLD